MMNHGETRLNCCRKIDSAYELRSKLVDRFPPVPCFGCPQEPCRSPIRSAAEAHHPVLHVSSVPSSPCGSASEGSKNQERDHNEDPRREPLCRLIRTMVMMLRCSRIYIGQVHWENLAQTLQAFLNSVSLRSTAYSGESPLLVAHL